MLYHHTVNKRYIGVTNDARTRLKTHRRSPPLHLRNALLANVPPGTSYSPQLFDDQVTFFELSSDHTKSFANCQERYYIRKYQTTRRANGYNVLQGDPGSDPRFQYMKATGVL
jgi:hypothetical protein